MGGSAGGNPTPQEEETEMPKYKHAPKPPKQPKPAKLPRPKTSELRKILKGVVTVSIHNRIASLSYALQWYRSALPYCLGKKYITASSNPKTPTKEQASLELAVKCCNLGIKSSIDHEQETSFLMAVRNYEKAFHKMKPPCVDTYYDQFKNKRLALEVKQKRMEQKFSAVLTMLQKIIGTRLKLVVADAKKPIQYDPDLGSVCYNRDAIKAMALQLRQEGILAVFLDQLEFLTRAASLTSDGHGNFLYDPAVQLAVVKQVLVEFLSFATSPDAPKYLVRKAPALVQGAQGAPTGAPTTPKAPRTFGGVKGPRVGGIYAPGSCGAIFYERLSDGAEWDMAKLFEGVAHAHPIGPLKKMTKDGPSFGWTVVINGTKVRLEKVVQP